MAQVHHRVHAHGARFTVSSAITSCGWFRNLNARPAESESSVTKARAHFRRRGLCRMIGRTRGDSKADHRVDDGRTGQHQTDHLGQHLLRTGGAAERLGS